MLKDLQNQLKKQRETIADAHLRNNFDENFAWIRTSGQTLTLKEINDAEKGIQQFVRLIFCYVAQMFIFRTKTPKLFSDLFQMGHYISLLKCSVAVIGWL